MNIGEVIKSKRQKRNITQAELGEMLGVTPQAVSRWEMGVSYPDIAMVPAISEALWVSADELLGIARQNAAPLGEALNQSQADSIYDYIPVSRSGESKRILVVDDSDFMRMMLEDILTHHGHSILQAENGRECLHILENETVDVCVLDIGMSVMDGLETLKHIKEEHPQIKVVMLSALSSENNVKLAMQLGAEAFVVKPFAAECLIERIG